MSSLDRLIAARAFFLITGGAAPFCGLITFVEGDIGPGLGLLAWGVFALIMGFCLSVSRLKLEAAVDAKFRAPAPYLWHSAALSDARRNLCPAAKADLRRLDDSIARQLALPYPAFKDGWRLVADRETGEIVQAEITRLHAALESPAHPDAPAHARAEDQAKTWGLFARLR